MLKGSTRYAVAIKKTLKAAGGGELAIPEGFQAILDDEKTSHALLERVRPRYKEIFAALEAKGIAKTDLVVAWDFTTGSRAVRARGSRQRRLAPRCRSWATRPRSLTFTQTETPQGDARIAKRYDGMYDAPLFLTNNGSTALSTKHAAHRRRQADGDRPLQGPVHRDRPAVRARLRDAGAAHGLRPRPPR